MTPRQAMERLLQGNTRYVSDDLKHPNRTSERREAIVSRQSPYAVILGCADSRVSPEIIFDEGIGDLFVVRVAGNVLGSLELESIKFAVLYLHSSIILVMGHENCGAVDAVIQNTRDEIETVAAHIEPSVQEARKTAPSDLLAHAVKANACRMRDRLLKSPVIEKLVLAGSIEVHAAYYNLQTGIVDILPSGSS
ncbi:MAG: carbonic anhydrase [Chlamydiae bacterium]|nr:carbonic anhydrase [Chlamydiota bacterium]